MILLQAVHNLPEARPNSVSRNIWGNFGINYKNYKDEYGVRSIWINLLCHALPFSTDIQASTRERVSVVRAARQGRWQFFCIHWQWRQWIHCLQRIMPKQFIGFFLFHLGFIWQLAWLSMRGLPTCVLRPDTPTALRTVLTCIVPWRNARVINFEIFFRNFRIFALLCITVYLSSFMTKVDKYTLIIAT